MNWDALTDLRMRSTRFVLMAYREVAEEVSAPPPRVIEDGWSFEEAHSRRGNSISKNDVCKRLHAHKAVRGFFAFIETEKRGS